ncbi:hypothetical protein KSP40_PGU012327 [Platanthera guangdongensis]|uniref:Uncharacterized protein n=1 Tax=Platanthera guangdongensis TaxID=2320717 RepID=A0ABR2MXG4_9ASPA
MISSHLPKTIREVSRRLFPGISHSFPPSSIARVFPSTSLKIFNCRLSSSSVLPPFSKIKSAKFREKLLKTSMEKRKSFARVMLPNNRQYPGGAAISGDAPALIHPTSPTPTANSPVHRKSISTGGGESPTSATSLLLPSPPRQKKSISDPPGKLRKQRSADKIHISGSLWPSAKTPGPAAGPITTLRDHFIEDNKSEEIEYPSTHASSTVSSRRRGGSHSPASDENIAGGGGRKGRGRRSKENHQFGGPTRKISGKGGSPKKPGTPPSPSSSSSAGPVHAGRRSDSGLDFPSTESDRSSSRNPCSRISRAPIKTVKIRKSGSPVRRSKSPSMRSSRSPVMHSSHSPVLLRRSGSPVEVAVKGAVGIRRQSPDKGWSGGGMGSIISLGIGNLFRRKSFSGAPVASTESTTMKWSPARGSAAIASSPSRGVQPAAAAVAESQQSLKMAHNQLLQWRFLNGKLIAVNDVKSAAAEIKGLERWGNMEKQHVAALSSTKNSFHAVVCRLPLTDRSKADIQILSILLRQATKAADAINSNLAKCNSMAGRTVPLAAELAEIASLEKPLIEECSRGKLEVSAYSIKIIAVWKRVSDSSNI